jgi:hypothetical protein
VQLAAAMAAENLHAELLRAIHHAARAWRVTGVAEEQTPGHPRKDASRAVQTSQRPARARAREGMLAMMSRGIPIASYVSSGPASYRRQSASVWASLGPWMLK